MCGPLAVEGSPWGMTFSPDASSLVTVTSRGQVARWSLPDGKRLGEPVKVNTTIQPVESSADSLYFVTGSTDGFVRIWNTLTGHPERQMKHGSEINSVAFSADGRLVASAGEDRVVRVWELQSGKLRCELTGHQNEVMRVAFGPTVSDWRARPTTRRAAYGMSRPASNSSCYRIRAKFSMWPTARMGTLWPPLREIIPP